MTTLDLETKKKQQTPKDGKDFLKDLVHYRTYAATLPGGRKESRKEVIDRVKQMHVDKFPHLEREISDAFEQVYLERVVPSMRTMQFAGTGILRSEARVYNCAFCALTSWKDFADCFWLLMNGVGTGYSVQKDHIKQLPVVNNGQEEIFIIEDNKESWADSLIALFENPQVYFVYDRIRKKGSALSTGGIASGPEALMLAHKKIRNILIDAIGRALSSLECFDVMCHISDVVVVGGVRRAATIALFNVDDEQMLNAKSGKWYVENPQRARANISAVIDKRKINFKEKIGLVLDKCFENNSGEPGVALSNDPLNYGSNPCNEISLRSRGFCNLTEINANNCKTKEEFYKAAESAAIIGTLQASYTNFYYIHPDWQKNAKEEALLGVSITGQAANWDLLTEEILNNGAQIVVSTNKNWAREIGINPAARNTTTKPSGTTSAWLATTSGMHSAHAQYYLRRVRIDRKDSLGNILINEFGEYEQGSNNFIESDSFISDDIVVTIPINMNGKTILREKETAIDLMERAKHVYSNWVVPGHNDGPNTHNISLTVTYRPEEKEDIKNWMINNTNYWSGISLLPYDGGDYIQSPFEEITKEEFSKWINKIPQSFSFENIDFSNSIDKREEAISCSANGCEII